MEQIGIELMSGLPVWFKMILVVFLLLVALFYILPRIRRDKQGKWYLYSQKYEDKKRNRKQDLVLEKMSGLEKDVLQLQVCSIELPLTAKRLAYRKYKSLGYNGWMDDYVIERGLFTKDDVSYAAENKEDIK
jgi:hypothetical protein